MNDIQAQVDLFETFKGRKGHHSDLAKALKAAGFVVELDSDDNELSVVKLAGSWNFDGSDTVIGEIRGDSEAEIV